MSLTQERLKELLTYSPETGLFHWLMNGRNQHIRTGSVAGCIDTNGYRTIGIDGQRYFAQRLAWFYLHGEWPETVDHVNGQTADNREVNLRAATQAQNLRNSRKPRHNTSGFKGVSKEKRGGWRAYISIANKYHHLGSFPTKEEAHAAYLLAAHSVSGEFARAA